MQTMAVPAKKLENRDHKGKFVEKPLTFEANSWQEAAAKLYGAGFRRPQVAKAMAHLFGSERAARSRLRRLEKKQEFRDQVYSYAVVETDLELPSILKGVTRAARRGRVDAAKLALAVTGRHSDKSDMPSEVVLRIDNGMPRPDERAELHGRQTTHPQLPEASTTDGAI